MWKGHGSRKSHEFRMPINLVLLGTTLEPSGTTWDQSETTSDRSGTSRASWDLLGPLGTALGALGYYRGIEWSQVVPTGPRAVRSVSAPSKLVPG